MIEALLQLPPELPSKEAVKKRTVRQPDLSTLTKMQEQAARELFDYLLGKTDKDMYLLEGYAGTGKTYTISTVVEMFLTSVKFSEVAVTAPVNKAVKILRNTAQYTDTRLSYLTVHSLLGLKPKVSYNGEIEYVEDTYNEPKITGMNVLILDEVSMLNDELFGKIYDYVADGSLKVIFVGDPAQIPPVKSKGHRSGADSIPLTVAGQETYNIGVVRLTEIIRQAGDSPIITLATDLRNNLLNRKPIVHDFEALQPNGAGIKFLSITDNKSELRQIVNMWFTSQHFENSADFAKIVAWRNDTVDKFNSIVRNMRYGKEAGSICVGEKLLADQPIIDADDFEKRMLFTVNDEFIVESFEIKEREVKGVALKYYWATVFYDDGAKQFREKIRILHEDSFQQYAEMLATMLEIAKAKTKEGKGLTYWKEFYSFQENFAVVKYNYAITAHKSQGSTYRNVLVVESDIDANSNLRERNRIKYTAVTRPSTTLLVIN